ncbi:MAG: OmpA family protein, partial [Bacteroidia bacterium]|nr:OmpA family protein [Bacteroidia bacterium]
VSQHDIFMSRIGDDARWSDPVSVSSKINTSADELSVFIHPDDQTLYFSSNGHTGMGGQDIFYSKRDSSGEWSEPINIGYPINTPSDEASLLVSPDGKIGFFSSDRPGGKGGEDLYQFDLYEKARPQPVTYMKGKVFDDDTKLPLAASFELIDLATGKIIVRSTSNSVTGQFIVCLPAGKSYALNVSKDGYLFYSDNFELKSAKSSKDPVLKDVPMKPIKAGQSIVLKNIFYDTDKFDLKQESKSELKKLLDFINKNPKAHFEISGHTDNVGSKPYNQTLSEKRAKTVYEYLITAGIPAVRLTSKGYGDTKPIAENSTDAGRAQNRRTEFLITKVDQ